MRRLFFSSPETGPWKNAFSTECIRNWSPGARVGHAYVKVDCMNGTPDVPAASACGSGTCRGRFGFAVADVGSGGRWSGWGGGRALLWWFSTSPFARAEHALSCCNLAVNQNGKAVVKGEGFIPPDVEGFF